MYTLPLAYLVDCGNPYLRQWGESRQQWEDRNKEKSNLYYWHQKSLALHLLTDGNLFSGLFHLWAIWDMNKTSLAHFVFFLSDGEPRFFFLQRLWLTDRIQRPGQYSWHRSGSGSLDPDSPGICSWEAKESCVQGGSPPKSVCWRSSEAKFTGLVGAASCPHSLPLGSKGEKWTGCPISMWSPGRTNGWLPSIPCVRWAGTLWDQALRQFYPRVDRALFTIRQLWSLRRGLQPWEWEAETSILSPDWWVLGTCRACTSQGLALSCPPILWGTWGQGPGVQMKTQLHSEQKRQGTLDVKHSDHPTALTQGIGRMSQVT